MGGQSPSPLAMAPFFADRMLNGWVFFQVQEAERGHGFADIFAPRIWWIRLLLTFSLIFFWELEPPSGGLISYGKTMVNLRLC